MVKKLSFFKSPFIIAAVICFAIALAIPLFAPKTTEVKGVSTKATATPTATNTVTPTEEAKTFNWEAAPTPLRQGSEGQATSISTSNTTAPTATSTTQPQQSPAVETFQVHLSVNGSNAGDVTMQKDQNQCDVLTRAKDQGKITQLLMKYDNSLGTNGVYQINGFGKENIVWWTYKVNGVFPSQGCSYIKANSGDNVAWEYQGN